MKILLSILFTMCTVSRAGTVCESSNPDAPFVCHEVPDVSSILPQPPKLDLPRLNEPLLPPPVDLPKFTPPPLANPPNFQVRAPDIRPALPRDSEIFKYALPNLDLDQKYGAIKTLGDMVELQKTLAGQLDKINDAYFEKLSENLAAHPEIPFEGITQMVPSEAGDSIMGVPIPKSLSNDDFKKNLEQQAHRNFEWDRPADNDQLADIYQKFEGLERATYDKYLADQASVTLTVLNSNLRSMSSALRSTNLSQLNGQIVDWSGELGGMDAHDELSQQLAGYQNRNVVSPPKNASLRPIYDRLNSILSEAPQAQLARTLGFRSIEAADRAYSEGDQGLGDCLKVFATAFADIGLGFIPVVGEVRDIYEFVSGKNLITGEELTNTERGLALAGVVTAGILTTVSRSAKAAAKIGAEARNLEKAAKVAEKVTETLGEIGAKNPESVRSLTKVVRGGRETLFEILESSKSIIGRAKSGKIHVSEIGIASADQINLTRKSGFHESYRRGSAVINARLDADVDLVRVYSSKLGNKERGWFVHYDSIKALSATDIKKYLNLEYIPDRLVKVNLPAGTRVRLSVAAKTSLGHFDGILQIEARPDMVIFLTERAL